MEDYGILYPRIETMHSELHASSTMTTRATSAEATADECPVDPATRQKWLEAARAKGQRAPTHAPTTSHTPPKPPTAADLKRVDNDPSLLAALRPQIVQMPQEQRMILLQQYQNLLALEAQHILGRTKFSLDALSWEPVMSNATLQSQSGKPLNQNQKAKVVDTKVDGRRRLSTDREVSSIPRALSTNHNRHNLNSAEAAALPPSNSERDTGHDRQSGNWVYPSQSMFFEAMKRKGHGPNAEDMETVIPIHNAVNEKAWSHILQWERHQGGEEEPKLVSFSGDSKKLTPKAWMNGWMGYEKPFDRHDWVVQSGGRKVEYVIDFYSGKVGGDGGGRGGSEGRNVSFYLDVRPKLNSWDGVKMRFWNFWGM